MHRFVNDLDTDEDSDVDSENYESIKGEETSDVDELEEDISEYASEDMAYDTDSMEDDLYLSQDDEVSQDDEEGIDERVASSPKCFRLTRRNRSTISRKSGSVRRQWRFLNLLTCERNGISLWTERKLKVLNPIITP